jgi:hypothetical protein
MINKRNARFRDKDLPLKNDESKAQNAEVCRAITKEETARVKLSG